MDLAPDFREFLSLLLSKDVRFLLVGAHALAVHGRPRYTGDLDVWVSPTPANSKRLIAALRAFGFGSLGLSTKDRLTTSMAGLEIPVLGQKDYVANKKAAGRPKDLLDLALLEEAQPRSPVTRRKRRRS